MSGKLRVRLRKSPISYTDRTRGTVRALGLHRLHETVEVPDNPATRGMVRAIRFLVDVEVLAAPAPRAKSASAKHVTAAGQVDAVAPAQADAAAPAIVSAADTEPAVGETGGGDDA
jgi:large subunit ribosomal protein L30